MADYFTMSDILINNLREIVMQDRPDTLAKLMDDISAQVQSDEVQLGSLVEAIGQASFTTLLLMPSVALVTPLSGIPLFSSLMGILIFLVSIQMLLRREHLWLPKWILRRKASGARVRAALDRIRPVMVWLDRHTCERLTIFMRRPPIYIPQILCAASGLVMPLFELVPFSSSLIGMAITLLSLGMLARDGLFILLGFVPYGALAFLIFSAS